MSTMEQEQETWKEIPDFNGKYSSSNMGRVKRNNYSYTHFWRGIFKINRLQEKILKPDKSWNGYLRIELVGGTDGCFTHKKYLVHRLVLSSFVGRSCLQVNHIDGNKCNNHVSNLEYCTASENVSHAFKSGLNKNRKNGRFLKVKQTDIPNIIMMRDNGLHYKDIAKKYNCSAQLIFQILKKLRNENP